MTEIPYLPIPLLREAVPKNLRRRFNYFGNVTAMVNEIKEELSEIGNDMA